MKKILIYSILATFHTFVACYPTSQRSLTGKWRRTRVRRGEQVAEEPASFDTPFGHNPLPAYRPESLEPVFPMVHSFNNGFNYQDNSNLAFYGHANVPIPSWGIWDLHADFSPQTSNPNLHFGYLMTPINLLNLSPREIDTLYHDPRIKAQRKGAQPVSVNDLPGSNDYLGYGGQSFAPLRCRPPLCNPYVHTFATGLQYQQGIDYQLPGKLDFPLPAKNPTEPSYRFTMTSDANFGVQPVAVQYAHDITGIDPNKTAFKPSANPGNPSALNRLLNPAPKNTVPFRQIPLDGFNIFQND